MFCYPATKKPIKNNVFFCYPDNKKPIKNDDRPGDGRDAPMVLHGGSTETPDGL